MTTLASSRTAVRCPRIATMVAFTSHSPTGARSPTPLWWYPRLVGAALDIRNKIEFMPMGLHWPELDEDISVASMLRGAKAPGAKSR